jgi:integrase
MVFSFARVGAALAMRVKDVYVQNKRLWVRLREKRGKRHEMPCHQTLEAYLHAYFEGTGIAADLKGPPFRTIRRGTGQLSNTPLPQANAYAMPPPASARRSVTTPSVRPASPRLAKTAARWRTPRRWRATHRPVPLGCTTGVVTTSAWTKWSGFACSEEHRRSFRGRRTASWSRRRINGC